MNAAMGSMRQWGTRGLMLVGLLAGLGGCSVKGIALRSTGEVMRQGSSAINEEPDFELARQSIPASLKTVEVLLASDPTNRDFLFLLAQGYDAYTYLVLEDELDLADAAGNTDQVRELKARATALYRRAQGYALRLLGPERLGRAETSTLDELRAAASRLEAEDVPGLFWYTFAWSGQINLDQSNPARIAELPRVEILTDRLLQLEPGYYHGLPLLIAGVLYAGRAPMFGGDLERGRQYLERGIQVSEGRFLLGKFLLARYWAVQTQQREAYCKLLTEVVQAPADLLPEQQLMNNVTRRWAQRWSTRAGSLFEQGGPAGCGEEGGSQGDSPEEDDGLLLQ